MVDILAVHCYMGLRGGALCFRQARDHKVGVDKGATVDRWYCWTETGPGEIQMYLGGGNGRFGATR